jgi:hypothetical protein
MESGAILVQEKLGRLQYEKIDSESVIKAIRRGWLLYDIYDGITFEKYDAHRFIAFKSNRQDEIQELFKDFKNITLSDLT